MGIGEATPLEYLSTDDLPEFERVMCETVTNLISNAGKWTWESFDRYPALTFGLETALSDLAHSNTCHVFDGPFTEGNPIEINGLVWMDEVDAMLKSAVEKIEQGFRCIKFKVGARDFDAECRMLEKIRKRWSAFKLEIRLDANGAFLRDEAEVQLRELSRFDIHSIEQPIGVNQWDSMERLCKTSRIPIALDEELIGLDVHRAGDLLLGNIRPQYIILKPNLLGGFKTAEAWTRLARKHAIGWWATSALESNIGLNAIAQWVSTMGNTLPQGLGTGSLYRRNIDSPLEIKDGHLHSGEMPWKLDLLLHEGKEILSC